MLIHVVQKFPDDQITKVFQNVQEVAIAGASDQMSHEDHASDILRCHYASLSQSLQHSIGISQMFYEEGVISQTMLAIIKDTAQSLSEDKATFLLLKALRHAVHTNYHNLEVFASVLLKQTSNIPCANAILKDCGKYMTHNY